jgi:hypothetical protein
MILLPGDKQLNAANWVTRGLLDEIAGRPDLPPMIASKVRWCLDAEFYTLDLQDATPAALEVLSRLVDEVIADIEKRGEASFQQPDMFPAFVGKLRELRALLEPAGARLGATYVFDCGSENAPDSPTGLERLLIQPNGRFRFHNRQRGQLVVERTGTIAPAAVEEIAGYLAGSGFPEVPDHPRPPGSDYLTISSGARRAFMNVPSARRFPGYGPLIRRIIPWMSYLVTCEGPPPAELELDPPSKP